MEVSMQLRSLALVTLAASAIIASACTAGATPKPALKIGVVTDVGQLEDKSFNQSSNDGAKAAAAAVGGTHDVIVTQNISDYKANIQNFIDKDFDVIVTIGFLIASDTAIAAKANPNVKFVGVDQNICVDEKGVPDPKFACKGNAATLMPNYQGILFAEEQPGYLAGIVAASISKSGVIASVRGTDLPAVVAYHAGYVAGAKSVEPNITVLSQQVDPDPQKGFNDPAKGKTIAQTFIGDKADVVFQIAGLTGQGALEAACAANVYGIGVDVDQALSIPAVAKCLVTSAEKKLQATVQAVIESVASGTFKAGEVVYNAASTPPAIGLSPYHDRANLITADTQAKLDKAFADMKAGTLKPPRK
jgi:basic membrane protein A